MPYGTVGKQSDPGNKGDGARGDGEQGKNVPIERLEEEIGKRQALEIQLAESRGKVDGLSAAPKPQEKPAEPAAHEFTRVELRGAVDNGKVTQDEADSIWDAQQDRKNGAAIEKVKLEVVEDFSEKSRIGGQIDAYKELVPDLGESTSDGYLKVQTEFNYMVKELGMDAKDLKTELAALRGVFGAVEGLKVKARDNTPDKHAGTATRGGGGGRTDDKDDDKTAPSDLSPKQKAYYQRSIDSRLYKGWDDPHLVAELKHIRSGRQKAA